MRSFIRPPAVRALAVLLLVVGALIAEGCSAQSSQPGPAAAADELLVGFVPGTTSAQAEAVYTPLGGTKIEEMPNIGVHRIRVAPGSVDSVERALKQSPVVRFVERNRPVRTN